VELEYVYLSSTHDVIYVHPYNRLYQIISHFAGNLKTYIQVSTPLPHSDSPPVGPISSAFFFFLILFPLIQSQIHCLELDD